MQFWQIESNFGVGWPLIYGTHIMLEDKVYL